MRREMPPPVLDYRRPPPTGGEPSRWRASAWLVGAFIVYVFVNVSVVDRALGHPAPWNTLLAFAIPLPLIFIVVALLSHFLASPPRFDGWILLAVIVLVVAAGVTNYYVLAEASAGV